MITTLCAFLVYVFTVFFPPFKKILLFCSRVKFAAALEMPVYFFLYCRCLFKRYRRQMGKSGVGKDKEKQNLKKRKISHLKTKVLEIGELIT